MKAVIDELIREAFSALQHDSSPDEEAHRHLEKVLRNQFSATLKRHQADRIADLERQLAELRAQPTWKCFHCDEEFTDAGQAALHFGTTQMQQPACQIDAVHVRELEAELARYREEDTDLHRQVHALHAAHHMNLQRAEEKGYARGLADARLLPTAQQVEDAARWRYVTEIMGLRFKPSNERPVQSLEDTNATVDAEIAALQAGKEKE